MLCLKFPLVEWKGKGGGGGGRKTSLIIHVNFLISPRQLCGIMSGLWDIHPGVCQSALVKSLATTLPA